MPRCQCLTQTNHRCSHNAVAGSEFCRMHQKCDPTRRRTPRAAKPAKAPAISDAVEATIIELVETPIAPPPETPAVPGESDERGTFEVIERRYQRAKVRLNGPPFLKDGQPTEKWIYNYPMPAVTVDLVVFDPTFDNVLLIQRGEKTDPAIYALNWAIPGGFTEPNESATQAAVREFNEEVSGTVKVDPDSLHHVYTATLPARDPRQRTVSVVFTTILNPKDVSGEPMDKQEIGKWTWHKFTDIMSGTLPVAFDHKNLIMRAWATQTAFKKLTEAYPDNAYVKMLATASIDKANLDLTKSAAAAKKAPAPKPKTD